MKYRDHENLYVYGMKENDENASDNSGMFHFYSRSHEYHAAAGTVNSGTACTSSVVQPRYHITIYIRVCIHSNKFQDALHLHNSLVSTPLLSIFQRR